MIRMSKVVGRYFDAWIVLNSWDSFHPLDLQRFYRFVRAVTRYSRKPLTPANLRHLIRARWKEQRSAGALAHAIAGYMEKYETLLDYKKTPGFPDPLIERRSIVKFYGRLTSQQGSNRHVERIMSNAWGKDWREKLGARWFPEAGTSPERNRNLR
jgi:hypothetical protein